VASLRYDLRGHGDSDGRQEEAPLAAHLNDIGLALTQVCKATGAASVSLLGASFGGGLCAYYVAKRSNDLRRLVLLNTNMFLQEDAPLENIDWPAAVKSQVDVRLVVPLLVVRELDRLKRRGNHVTVKEARRAIKWLEANLPMDPHGTSAPLSTSPETTVEVYVQHEPARTEEVDGLIVELARQLASVSRMPTRLVTRDLGMRLQAEVLGVGRQWLPARSSVLREGSGGSGTRQRPVQFLGPH